MNVCKRCGKCCSSLFFAFSDIPIDKDEDEKARWISYHGCEPMKYETPNGEVLALRVPISCKHLVIDAGTGLTSCAIYNTRPVVCKKYFCKFSVV